MTDAKSETATKQADIEALREELEDVNAAVDFMGAYADRLETRIARLEERESAGSSDAGNSAKTGECNQ